MKRKIDFLSFSIVCFFLLHEINTPRVKSTRQCRPVRCKFNSVLLILLIFNLFNLMAHFIYNRLFLFIFFNFNFFFFYEHSNVTFVSFIHSLVLFCIRWINKTKNCSKYFVSLSFNLPLKQKKNTEQKQQNLCWFNFYVIHMLVFKFYYL